MPARSVLASACVAVAATALLVPAAHAVTCFIVMDRNENVIYRDVLPPVDLSDAGKAAREAMRQRGEFFLFHDAEICPRLEFFTGGAGNVALALDQTLAPTTVPPKAPTAMPGTPAGSSAKPAAATPRR
jgi:hypothetical protein